MAFVLGLGLISAERVQAVDPGFVPPGVTQPPRRLGFQGVFNGMGMRVVSVETGSLAQVNGVEVGDVVTQVNGLSVTSYSRYLQLIEPALSQGSCQLTVWDHRSGQLVNLTINMFCAPSI